MSKKERDGKSTRDRKSTYDAFRDLTLVIENLRNRFKPEKDYSPPSSLKSFSEIWESIYHVNTNLAKTKVNAKSPEEKELTDLAEWMATVIYRYKEMIETQMTSPGLFDKIISMSEKLEEDILNFETLGGKIFKKEIEEEEKDKNDSATSEQKNSQ